MDIAIVGLGCRFPQARDPVAYWDLIRRGDVTFRPIPKDRWDHSLFYDPAARVPDKTYIDKGAYLDESEIREFGALHFGLAPRRLQVTDPQHRLLLDAVRGALQDAGYETKPYDRSRTGVFIGASANEHKEVLLSRLRSVQLFDGAFGRPAADGEAMRSALVEDVAPMRAFSMPGNLLNMSAAIVAQTFDLGGPAMSIDAACSSALVASQQAIVNLRARQVDVAIAGGVYINLLPDNLVSFARIGAISRKGECRPFDAAADGFVMGEGVGAVVLKRLDDAVRDGDRVYAVVKGAASNNDGKSEGPMTPRAGGQLDALRMAYRDAGFSPATLGYVEAHGTATTVGDAVEVSALRTLFEEAGWSPADGARTAMGSVKANIGHTMSAAGIAGLIKAVLALHHKSLPPQPSIGEENPKLQLGKGPFFLPRTETPWKARDGVPRRAGVSSFGFGGTNAHLALEEAPERSRRPLVQVPRGVRAELFLVGGPRASVVARHARHLAASLSGELPDIAFTLSRRAAGDARLAIVAESVEQLRERLLASADALEKRGDHAPDPVSPPSPSAPVQLLPFAVFAQGPFENARVALLFPGQGAQKVGLLREAYEQLPAFAQALDALDDSLGPELHAQLGGSLRSFLYAAPSAEAEERLMATQICQPVMAAVGLALHALLSRMGLSADFALGHSLGEFAAAAAAGLITPEECVRLVAQRGLAMTKLPEAGAMASAAANVETVAAALQDGAVVANLNHPNQTVISGNTEAVRVTSERLAGQGVQVTALQVSHAFHSPLMSGIEPAMRELLLGLQLRPASVTVVSGITGGTYPDSPAEIRDIWLRHGTAPVDFVAALRSSAKAGARVFVQAGAGSVLTSFVRATLPASERLLNVSLASREPDGLAQLSLCLGQLWSIGVPLDFGALYEGRSVQLVTLPPTAIDVQPYWAVERPKIEREPLRLSSPAQEKPMPVDDPLVALFREQVALLTQQAKTLEARGLLPAGASAALPAPALPRLHPAVALPDAPLAAPAAAAQVASVPQPLTIAADARADKVASPEGARPAEKVAAAILASVARISAFPVEAIQPTQTLNGDLGFDSLMTVELDTDVSKAFPGVGALPRSLLGPQTTVQQVIDHVAHALSSPAAKAAPTLSAALGAVATEKPELLLFASKLVEAKLHQAPPDDPLPKRIHLTRDSLGVATLLERKLRACGHEVAGASDGMGALVHLAALDGADIAEALRLARAQPRGGMFVAVTAGAATGGLPAFVRSLAREREDDLVKSIQLRRDDSIEAMADAIFAELRSGDAAQEVTWSRGVRFQPEMQPAAASEPISLGEGDVVIVTGGTRGIGRKLASALHADGATVILAGRSAPQGALGERETFLPWDLTQPPPALPAGITALVHAAGITEDAPVRDTDAASLARVLSPKLHGLERALAALQGQPLRVVVGISSWAARFGNAAQAGYAAANAAMEERLARLEGVRTLSLQYPPWDGTAMVAKIPPLVRRALEEQGVPFIDDAQGVAAFRSALRLGAGGSVLLSHTKPSRTIAFKTQVRLSRAEHPFLDDHQLAGQPVLPLASALDFAAQAAADAVGKRGSSLSVRDFRLLKPIRIAESAELSVAAAGERELAVSVFARPDSSPSYSAFAVAGADVQQTLSSARPAPAPQGPVALPIGLDEFYDGYTFHGPRLRGIKTIEQLDSRGIVGTVRTGKPSDWIAHPGRSDWAVDPLAIDGAFQLAAYWAWTHLQRAGFPIGIEEYVQLEPLRGTLRASLQLEQSAGDEVRGSIVLQASDGRVVALMRGVSGEFKHRDPRFLRGRGPARSTPPQVQPLAQPAVVRSEQATQPASVPVPNVASENYRIEEFAEVQELEQRLGLAAAFGLKNPYFNVHERVTNDTSVIGGRTMINWSSYNYLGLSGDPAVTRAAQAAVERYGTSVSASRIASGEKPLHRELEEELARLLGTEDSIVTVSGHGVFVTTIATLVKDGDLVLHDSLAHDCIMAGAKLSGAKRRPFPHNDWRALEKQLATLRPHYRRVLIAIEGVYSMDGDSPDLPKFIELKKKYGCLLLVDEAHSIGVMGSSGAGIGEHFGVHRPDVDLWMGTLSKSFASCGGYVGGSKALVQFLKYSAGGFVYSVGISPANAAAALEALRQLRAHPEKVSRLHERASLFLRLAKAKGIDTGSSSGSAVVPAILGNSMHALQVSDALKQRGINVQPILYPAVEETAARLRFFCTATHTEQQIRETIEVLAEEIDRVRAESATGSD